MVQCLIQYILFVSKVFIQDGYQQTGSLPVIVWGLTPLISGWKKKREIYECSAICTGYPCHSIYNDRLGAHLVSVGSFLWGDRASGMDSNPSSTPKYFFTGEKVVFFEEISGNLRKIPQVLAPKSPGLSNLFPFIFGVIKWDKFEQHHPKKWLKMMGGFIHLSFWWGETWT